MSRSRYRFVGDDTPYFMTCTVVGWLPVFSKPAFVEIIFDSWRFLQAQRGITIFGYVILENHLHWIAGGSDISQQVGRFKSFTARRIIDAMDGAGYETMLQELRFQKLRHKIDQEHQLCQEGNHPQQILGDDMMRQKLDYIHANPVKRGYVDDPTHWRYSSARDYEGAPGLLDVTTDWDWGSPGTAR